MHFETDLYIRPAVGAYLRSFPNLQNKTKVILIPQGAPVKKLSSKGKWAVITASYDGLELKGYVLDKDLETEVYLESVPQKGISEVHLPTDGVQVTRNGINRAHPLNEATQPGLDPQATAAERVKSLSKIITWLRVEHSRRYAGSPPTTYCNIYAHDYCYLSAAYLPRIWWTPKSITILHDGGSLIPRYGVTVSELTANRIFEWLREFGPDFGWVRAVDLTEIQEAANSGKVVIICAQRHDLNLPGHICVVVPEIDGQQAVRSSSKIVKPLQSQAGLKNYAYKSWVWWTQPKFRDFGFWIHS